MMLGQGLTVDFTDCPLPFIAGADFPGDFSA